MNHREISIQLSEEISLQGTLNIPKNATKLIVFAHGSGSGRFSPRNQQVAQSLIENQMGTLLFDLLTPKEELIDNHTREFRFNISLLAERLYEVTKWLKNQESTKLLKIGYFGASTGAAAALIAGAQAKADIFAIVSRGGRPDLAGPFLTRVISPTLLIVGGEDHEVIKLNKDALEAIPAEKKLEIVPGATHLFEESGTLEMVEKLAASWFLRW